MRRLCPNSPRPTDTDGVSLERCIEMLQCAGHRDARGPHDGRLRGGRAERDARWRSRRDAYGREPARRRRRIVQRRHHRRERVDRRRRRQVDIAKPVNTSCNS